MSFDQPTDPMEPLPPEQPLPPVPPPGAPEEPLLTVGTFTALAVAVLALIATFVDIDNDKQSAILGVVAVVAPIVVAILGRGRVFAPKTVRNMVLKARNPGGPL